MPCEALRNSFLATAEHVHFAAWLRVMWPAGGMVPPLYIHKSAHTSQASQLSEASFEAEWMQRVADVSRAQVCQRLLHDCVSA